jgi:glycolate oxidase FAD binding subunit
MNRTVEEFADEIGSSGPITVEGAATRGGAVPGVRTVRAPSGIERVDAAEMVLQCGASTPVDEVHAALAEVGQTVLLPPGGTVGGALAVGHSDVTRLGHGPMRDALLQTRYAGAGGEVITAGGPTVKNVSGFDLCRLLVGSRGTLGFLADVVLRTRPLARSQQWFTSSRDPFDLITELYRPVSVLWDGETAWVRLDGDPHDIAAAARGARLDAVEGPPDLPGPYRWSIRPSEIVDLQCDGAGPFVAEVGVGVVHRSTPPPARSADTAVVELHRRLAAEFDPEGRLNPGVDPLLPVTGPLIPAVGR